LRSEKKREKKNWLQGLSLSGEVVRGTRLPFYFLHQMGSAHFFSAKVTGMKELNICKGKCVKAQKKSRMLNFDSNAELKFFLLKVGVTCKTDRLH